MEKDIRRELLNVIDETIKNEKEKEILYNIINCVVDIVERENVRKVNLLFDAIYSLINFWYGVKKETFIRELDEIKKRVL